MGDCVGQTYDGQFYSPVKTDHYHPGDEIDIKFYGGKNNGSDPWRAWQLFFQSRQDSTQTKSSDGDGITILIGQVNYTFPSAQWTKSDACDGTTVDYGKWTIPTELSPQQDEQFVIIWRDTTNSSSTNGMNDTNNLITATSDGFQVFSPTTTTSAIESSSSAVASTTSASQTSTSTASPGTLGGSVSKGMQAGVGVGAALVFVILLAVLFLFWGRRTNKSDYVGYDPHSASRVFEKSQLDLAVLDHQRMYAMTGANGRASTYMGMGGGGHAMLQQPQRAALYTSSHRSLMVSPVGSISERSQGAPRDYATTNRFSRPVSQANSRRSVSAISENIDPEKTQVADSRSRSNSQRTSVRLSQRSFLDAESKEMLAQAYADSHRSLAELPALSHQWTHAAERKAQRF